jgi:hypothetical protein
LPSTQFIITQIMVLHQAFRQGLNAVVLGDRRQALKGGVLGH